MKVGKEYPGAMSTMYATSRILMENCKTNQATFAAFKGLYTQAYFDSIIDAIDAAQALPSDEARSLEHITLRNDLTAMAKSCLSKWQALKLYIKTAYAEALWTANWNAAGWNSYADAGNNNWDKVSELMSEGSVYLSTHADELKENENMPDAFVAEFDALADEFNATYSLFIHAREDAMVGSESKVEANNAVYARVIACGEDGQFLFEDNEAMRRQFSYSAISELVSPSGSSTLIVTVTNAETGMALSGAEVHVDGTERTVVTNADGRAEIGALAAGATSGTIIRDGYADTTFSTTLGTGTTTRIESAMSALIASPGPVPVTTPEPVVV